MAITPLSSTALQGIQRGVQGLSKSAAKIAGATQSSDTVASKDMIRSMVELHKHEYHTAASVKAFKTADQLIGSLLDIKA